MLLIGAGGHARACADVIRAQGLYEIAGLVGTGEELGQSRFGFPVIATDKDLPSLVAEYRYALIAVGQIRSSNLRMSLYQQLREQRFELPVVVSPIAYVSPDARLGPGTIVMHGAIVNAGACVGANCIVNSKALIEHDALVADHCHLSTGAIINGNVRIGEGCFIGSGSVIREGVSIGRSCVIGMGTSIRADLEEKTNAFGNGTWCDIER